MVPVTFDGLAGRCPVGGATHQGFGRALRSEPDDLPEQRLDRADGGGAQNLAHQPLPAPTVGPGPDRAAERRRGIAGMLGGPNSSIARQHSSNASRW